MKTCAIAGCSNPQFGGGVCKYHQYTRHMRGGDLYKPKARQKKPKAESDKRKREHIRYLDQIQMMKKELIEKGEFFCFITGEEFDETIDGYPTIHHLRGRTGDYYLDKKYFIFAKNKEHLDVFHSRMTYEQMSSMPWWEDFLRRLKEKDEESYQKIMRQKDRAKPLNPKIWDDDEL